MTITNELEEDSVVDVRKRSLNAGVIIITSNLKNTFYYFNIERKDLPKFKN